MCLRNTVAWLEKHVLFLRIDVSIIYNMAIVWHGLTHLKDPKILWSSFRRRATSESQSNGEFIKRKRNTMGAKKKKNKENNTMRRLWRDLSGEYYTFGLLTKPWGQDGNGGLNIIWSQTRDKIAFASSLSNYTKEFVLFLRLNMVVFVRLHEPCGVWLPLWKIWPRVNQGCIKIMNMKGNQRK